MASAKVHLLEDGDDTPQFGEEEDENSDKLKHPVVTFFHLAFRVSALVVYILCGWFSNSFITSFVTVVLLLSMDFWTVKNITGRLMVGLRWWNYVDDNGKSHWVYEFKKGSNQNRINSSEARIFWLGLVFSQLMWAILFIVALLGFKFKWLLLVSIALALNGANLYGYIKCKVGSNDSMSSSFSNISSNFVWQQLIKNEAGLTGERAFTIDGKYLRHLRFADDVVLVATKSSNRQEMLPQLNTPGAQAGLTINLSKKTMYKDMIDTRRKSNWVTTMASPRHTESQTNII